MAQPTPNSLDPPPMYRVRPYFAIKKVKLPDCMYMMKPIHHLPDMKTGTDESTQSALSYLEHRQEWVLSQVEKLQERVRALGQKLGISPADVGVFQQTTSGGIVQDVVITCPPSAPPYALLALYKYISRKVPTTCSVFVHSSATQAATDDMRRFFGDFESKVKPQLRITLVWKSESVCRAPTMIVSPHNQTPVEGIANISRYLCREFCPELYEALGASEAAKIDSWLDSISGTFLHGSAKEKASVLRRLNSQLGAGGYLVGERVTVADVVGYTVVCREKAPTGNVKQWLKLCQQLPEFAGIPCSCISNS